ncbi:MAG: ArsC family reductase [Burkholderiaceae bacterium]
MTDIVIHGIDNCDTVRKARSWLKDHGLPYRFHDFRKDGLTEAMLQRWLSHVPWDALLNRRGLTWRRLTPAQRDAVVDQASAIDLMLREPTIVKRPVLEAGDRLLVGFSDPLYQGLLPA